MYVWLNYNTLKTPCFFKYYVDNCCMGNMNNLTNNGNVQKFTFTEHCVQCDFANLRAHCCLC